MQTSQLELINRLKTEILVIERGGYHPSVHEPRVQPQLFRDSVSCLNFGSDIKKEPCSKCFLFEFVPPEHAYEQEPCHHIPLNANGDTIASLEAHGQHEKAEELLLEWLRSTLAKLESVA